MIQLSSQILPLALHVTTRRTPRHVQGPEQKTTEYNPPFSEAYPECRLVAAIVALDDCLRQPSATAPPSSTTQKIQDSNSINALHRRYEKTKANQAAAPILLLYSAPPKSLLRVSVTGRQKSAGERGQGRCTPPHLGHHGWMASILVGIPEGKRMRPADDRGVISVASTADKCIQ